MRSFILDLVRTIPLIIAIVLCFSPDWSALLIVKYVFGFLFSQALITLVIRKILFPYVDLREFVNKAKESPVASAMIFLGFSIIISVMIVTSAMFFK